MNNQQFITFLSSINLDHYREKYSKNKSVEEDLPRNIQIIPFIYDQYWVSRDFIDFDPFIQNVIKKITTDLENYNMKRNGNSIHAENAYPAFLDGWIARQYRTWTSILTQIQLGYVCETLFPDKKILMSPELDYEGVDVRIEGLKDLGVKKNSKRDDIRKMHRLEAKGVVPIKYEVPGSDILKNPKKKNGDYKSAYLRFKSDKRIEILPNGFIIFTENIADEVR